MQTSLNRFIYNIKGIGRMLTPSFLLPKNREKILRDLDSRKDLDYIKKRVDYYCPMSAKITLDGCAKSLDFLRWTRKQTVYFFDCYKYARYFPQRFKAHFEFGDVYYIPQKPSFAKSRPILDYFIQSSLRGSGNATTKQSTAESSLQESQSDRSNPNLPRHCEESKRPKQSTNPKIDCHDFATQNLAMTSWVDSSLRESRSDSWQSAKNINGGGQNELNGVDSRESLPFTNATLLNMDKIRHFIFINDNRPFESKQNKLFYRGGIYRANRIDFFEKYFGNPLCDLGHTGSKNIHHAWQKPKISIAKHLPYKFLLSLEGNDVASNLKWVMSSNSLCVAPKMKFETWFMEGRLKGGEHFVEISDDYSDLEEKLEYFFIHPKDALEIIHNAHEYIAQFRDKKREDIISLLVLEKYFYYTGQIDKMRI